jgi:hypothetical protein
MLVEHWKTLVGYVKRRETSDLHRPLGQLTIAPTGAALVGMMQVKENTTPSDSGDITFSRNLLLIGDSAATVALPNTITLPFLSENAIQSDSCDNNG